MLQCWVKLICLPAIYAPSPLDLRFGLGHFAIYLSKPVGRALSLMREGHRGLRLDLIYVGLFCRPAQKWKIGGAEE